MRKLRFGRAFVFFLVVTLLFITLFWCSAFSPNNIPLTINPQQTTENQSTTHQLPHTPDNFSLTIGVFLPLSGEYAPKGEEAKRAISLAIDEINDPKQNNVNNVNTQKINGQKIHVVYEDSACTVQGGTNAFKKLLDNNVSAVIGGLCNEESLAAALLAERHKVVLLSIGASSPDVTIAGDYVFRVWPSDNLQGIVLAEHVYGKGLATTSLVFANTDFALNVKDAFKKRYETLGGKIVDEILYEPLQYGPVDLSQLQSQAVFIAAESEQLRDILTYYVAGQVFSTNIETGGTGSATDIISQKTNTTINITINTTVIYAVYHLPQKNDVTKKFVDTYTKRYGAPADPLLAANAYDATILMVKALEKSAASNEIKNYLYSINGWLGAGGKMTIDNNGDAIKELELVSIG